MIVSSLCNAAPKFSGEDGIDVRKMNEHKRSPCSIDQNTFPSKRKKPDLSVSTKERKENVGAKIVALQQLVSPNGKTDTASVLSVAMEYIQFLHEQVKVLSAPYLQSVPAAALQELEAYSLRSRGLCVVPVSCTHGVARSNGADIWAPIKNTSPKFDNNSPKFENSLPPFH